MSEDDGFFKGVDKGDFRNGGNIRIPKDSPAVILENISDGSASNNSEQFMLNSPRGRQDSLAP